MKLHTRNVSRWAALAVTSTACLTLSATASADFTGYYDPANWTWTELGTGVGSYVADANTLVMTTGDAGVDTDSYFHILAAADGTFSFDWAYSSVDDPGFDAGYYVLDDLSNYIFLSTTDGESGSISVQVSAGDLIGFNVYSVDGEFGPGVLTITNFAAPVPEPASMAILGLGAAALLRRRRK